MLSKQTVSLADVAKEAGVSPTTVSRVLNHKGGEIRISDATQQRVWEAAKRLGYQRNAIAHALRADKTGLIGAVNRSISGSFMSTLSHALQILAQRKGVELFVGRTRLEKQSLEAQLNFLQEQLFDGYFLLGDVPAYENILQKLKKLDKPFVAVAADLDSDTPTVEVDQIHGTHLAMDYLTKLGHQKIAFLGSINTSSVTKRFNSYLHYLKSNGLEVRSDYISHMGNLVYQPEKLAYMEDLHRASIQYAQQLMQLPDPPTAIFCGADGFALGAMKGIMRLGLKIPDDVSVVGFDDSREAFLYDPELTTIHQPVETIAMEAVTLLLKLIDSPNDDTLKKHILIEPKLIIRDSCAPPKR